MKKATNFTVYSVLDALKIDNEHFEVLFCFDKDEIIETDAQFAENHDTNLSLQLIARNYVLIRCIDTKRAIIKLWGHKDSVTVEISKSMKKRKEYCVDKSCYTNEKVKIDRNDNYICQTQATAVAMCTDFLKQVEKNLYKSTKVVETTDKSEEIAK